MGVSQNGGTLPELRFSFWLPCKKNPYKRVPAQKKTSASPPKLSEVDDHTSDLLTLEVATTAIPTAVLLNMGANLQGSHEGPGGPILPIPPMCSPCSFPGSACLNPQLPDVGCPVVPFTYLVNNRGNPTFKYVKGKLACC